MRPLAFFLLLLSIPVSRTSAEDNHGFLSNVGSALKELAEDCRDGAVAAAQEVSAVMGTWRGSCVQRFGKGPMVPSRNAGRRAVPAIEDRPRQENGGTEEAT